MSGYNSLYDRYHTEAKAYAAHYGLDPKTDKGGTWDAFRHGYASGAMTREYSETPAHIFGVAGDTL